MLIRLNIKREENGRATVTFEELIHWRVAQIEIEINIQEIAGISTSTEISH